MNDDTPAPSTPTALVPAVMPGRNGGTLNRGNPGNKGGGRPASVIREALRGDFEKRRRKLREIADNKPDKDGKLPYTTADQLKALDLMAKYGMGQPVEVGGPDGSPFTVAVRAATDGDG